MGDNSSYTLRTRNQYRRQTSGHVDVSIEGGRLFDKWPGMPSEGGGTYRLQLDK